MERIPKQQQEQQDRQLTARRHPPAPSGLGETRKVFKYFYGKRFWYGFDIDDSAQVGDNAIFGGTKGKFNGLDNLLAEQKEGENERYCRSSNSMRSLPLSINDSVSYIASDYRRRT